MSGSLPYFHDGGLNCAESTLRLLIEDGAVDLPAEAVRLMSGFGGGMQRGLTCGVVTACVAAIGWQTGRTDPGQSRTPSAEAVRAFLEDFEGRFGALECAALTEGLVSKSPEMYRHCTEYVVKAAQTAAAIIKLAKEGQQG